MNPVRISETVLFYDTDCGGVVSNIAYLRYVEKARVALFEKLGMGLAEMNESQLFPAVIRTEIDYLMPARLGDLIEVEAVVCEVGKVRATCQFELTIKRSGDEEVRLSARAKQVVALVQMPSGRPKRIPAEWISAIS